MKSPISYFGKICKTEGCSETDESKFRKIRDSLAPRCKECEKKISRENRKARYHDPALKAIIIAQNKAYSSKPEVIAATKAKSHEKYELNKEAIKRKTKVYRQNPANKARRNQLWREKYASERDERRKEFKKKYHSNPEFRLRGNIRSRIWEALKINGGHKDSSVLKNLGYSMEELQFHIESQFTPEMNWEDTKSFSLDHIIPQSMFKFKSLQDEQFRLCWGLHNLRPLISYKNYSEGNRNHLFHGCSDWNEVANLIRKWGPGPDTESNTLEQIYQILSNITISGNDLPKNNSGISYLDSIFTHRFDSRTENSKSLNELYNNDMFLAKIVAYIIGSGRPISKSNVYRNAAFLSKTPSHFFPSAASALVQKYARGGDVLDPFLGWGGRTLGALCGGARSISGTDLQEKSVLGCRRVVEDFSRFNPVESEFENADFSEYLRTTTKKFDLLMTSPPFMGTEDYQGVETHSSSQIWSEKIAQPLALGAKRVLRPGGLVAIHGQERRNLPVSTILMSSLSMLDFKKIDEFSYGRNNSQLVFVFKKPEL